MAWKFRDDLIPMKARGKLDPAMWESLDWVAEVKEDGDRRLGQFCSSGLVRFTGTPSKKHGKPVEKTGNLPHLNGSMVKWNPTLVGTVLDGEIIAEWANGLQGGKSKHVTKIMGSDPGEAIRKQQVFGWLSYVVFDCLFYQGKDLRDKPLRIRQNFARQALLLWESAHVRLVGQRVGVVKQKFYDAIIANGGEGVILKNIHDTHGDPKRWIKVKGKATADVVVMGFELGKGKYKNKVGAIKFGQFKPGTIAMVELGSCSGMDDGTRFGLTKKDIGRVFKIEHLGREPTGRFRSPQFKGWRDDKAPTDCIYDLEEK